MSGRCDMGVLREKNPEYFVGCPQDCMFHGCPCTSCCEIPDDDEFDSEKDRKQFFKMLEQSKRKFERQIRHTHR